MHRQLPLCHFPLSSQQLLYEFESHKTPFLKFKKEKKTCLNYVSTKRTRVLDHVAISKYGYKIMSREKVEYKIVPNATVYKVM
jgi:hypothetical protein